MSVNTLFSDAGSGTRNCISINDWNMLDNLYLKATEAVSGQVIGIDSSQNLVFYNNNGSGTSGVNQVTAGNNNLLVNPESGDVVISLSSSINVNSIGTNLLGVNNFTNIWTTNPETSTQILACDPLGNLSWVNQSGDGTTYTASNPLQIIDDDISLVPINSNNKTYVSNAGDWVESNVVISLGNTDNNLNVESTNNEYTINLKNTIDLSGITTDDLTVNNFKNIWETNPTLPNQILSSDLNGNLSWVDNNGGGGSGTIEDISSNTLTIINSTGPIVNIDLPIQNIDSGTFTNATVGVNEYGIITSISSGANPLTTFESGNNIIADPTAQNQTVKYNLATDITGINSLETTDLTVSNFTNIWITNPLVSGYVLSSDINGNLSWVDNNGGGSSGTVEDISSNTLTITNSTGPIVNIDLPSTLNNISLTNATVNAVVMPSTQGTTGQVLKLASSTSAEWQDDNSGGSGITQVLSTLNEVIATTNNSTVTVSLPDDFIQYDKQYKANSATDGYILNPTATINDASGVQIQFSSNDDTQTVTLDRQSLKINNDTSSLINTSTQLSSNTLTITDLVSQHNIFINTESFNVSDQISGEQTNDTKNTSILDISGLQINYTDFNTESNNLSTVIDKESITISAANNAETLELTYNDLVLTNTTNQEQSVLYPASLTITDLSTDEFSKLNATGLTTNTLTLNTGDGLMVNNLSIDFSSPVNNNVLLVDSANNQLMYLDSYISTETYQTIASGYWVDGESISLCPQSFTVYLNRVGGSVSVSIDLVDGFTDNGVIQNTSGITADSFSFVITDPNITPFLLSSSKTSLYTCSEKINILMSATNATGGVTSYIDWFPCTTMVAQDIPGQTLENAIVIRLIPDPFVFIDGSPKKNIIPREFCLNSAYAFLGHTESSGSAGNSNFDPDTITITYQIF